MLHAPGSLPLNTSLCTSDEQEYWISTVEFTNSGNVTSNNTVACSIGHIPSTPVAPIISFLTIFL